MPGRLSLESLKPSDLPSPPRVALEIVRACARDDIGSTQLSRLTASDPVLTAELLRVANSPYFGAGHEVASIARAITVLGHKALRNLALCLAVRDAMHRDPPPGFDAGAYWEDALLRAVCARLLGRRVGLDRDDCFTAGILQDFGLLVMLHLDHAAAACWPELRRLDPDARLELEFARFGMTHDAVVALLATVWELPEDLGAALGAHHYRHAGTDDEDDQDTAACPPLARVLYAADWMTAVWRATAADAAIAGCGERLTALGVGVVKAGELLLQAPDDAADAGMALGLRVVPRRDAATEATLEARREAIRDSFSVR